MTVLVDMDLDMGIEVKQKKILSVSKNMALFYDPSNGHHCIKALTPLSVDYVLHDFTAREYVDAPTYLTVQVDDDKHLLLSPEFLQYINHSCEPNVFFDTKNGKIIVIKEISSGEEITFFYPSTEWSMALPFNCFCQSETCLGEIKGAKYLPKNSKEKYRFNEYIKNKLNIRKINTN